MLTERSQFRSGKAKFLFDYINIHLCNHVIFSSVIISEHEEDEAEGNSLNKI